MAGQMVTGAEVQAACGRVAVNLKVMFQSAQDINDFLLAHDEASLIAIGLSAGDIVLLKSAMADLAYMKATAFESSPFVKQLWGLGS